MRALIRWLTHPEVEAVLYALRFGFLVAALVFLAAVALHGRL